MLKFKLLNKCNHLVAFWRHISRDVTMRVHIKATTSNVVKFASQKAIANERRNVPECPQANYDGITVILDGGPYDGQNDRVITFIECIMH